MRRHVELAAVTAIALALGACASRKPGTPDNEPTLATLADREAPVRPDQGVKSSEDKAIAAYRSFLDASPQAPQRAQALRRLGDLEMDGADARAAGATANAAAVPDYRAAKAQYLAYLKAYPNDPSNDRVLYQLARAQEQDGELEAALKTLDRLVDFPRTIYRDEAQFRRGELLFTTRDYVRAEAAYTTVLLGDSGNPYRERALYMQGWSRFKQGRLEDALQSFFGVLDLKVANMRGDDLESLPLTRADRELVEDTFRVTSISLANLSGAQSIPPYITTSTRRSYEFRVYQQLGDFYLKQERIKDAADTYAEFARRVPLNEQAPVMQARVIDIYAAAGFQNQALQAKKDFVTRYAADGTYARESVAGWGRAQPLLKANLEDLARHYHAAAQKSHASADYQEAARWYRSEIASFPKDADAPRNNFLLAELLFEDKHFAEAQTEYEHTAYDYPQHERSADAGYAALLANAQQQKAQGDAAKRSALQREGVDSAVRFGQTFRTDPRTAAVLTNAAETLFKLGDGARAANVAQQVVDLVPPASEANRRTAWTVLGHSAFDSGQFEDAERAYAQVLALTPERDPTRTELTERLAASIYKQGEAARAAGHTRLAVTTFERVAATAPQSSVRATAQYDAAAALIELKDWPAATRSLEDFRRRYPDHPLQSQASAKLAAAYLEQKQWARAAGELERVAATDKDPQRARDALWQAAELQEKDGSPAARAAAVRDYERYAKQYPQPLDGALEARLRLAEIAQRDGNAARRLALMKEIQQTERSAGAARSDRTRAVGAQATLALAEPAYEAYRSVALVEPLQRQLKLKKTRMEEALKAYGAAADYGVASVTTAATYRTGAIYQDFAKALLASERPKLARAELEQYNVLLEEQAFPFEEKAAELHEINARRAATGVYDEWVRASYKALAALRPVRWGKEERGEGAIDAIR